MTAARLGRRAFLLAALASGVAVAAPGDEDPLAERFGGSFSLIDHNGRRVDEKTFRGVFLLVSFGFTHCPDVCPTTLATIAGALDRLGPLADRLQPLFVTLDPRRDRPDVLRDYLASLHPRILGLTGGEAEIAAIARAYRVHRRIYAAPGAAAGDYSVDHGSLTYLMGRDGRFVTLFPYGVTAERMALVLRGRLERAAGGPVVSPFR